MVSQLALAAWLISAAPPAEADLKTLAAAGINADGPGLLDYLRRRSVNDRDKGRIVELIKQLGDTSYAERQRASKAIVEVGLPAVGPLRQAVTSPDVEVVRRAERCLKAIEAGVPAASTSAAVLRALARVKPEGAAEALLAYLPFADDETVTDEAREALAAVALDGAAPVPAVVAALDDPTSLRRGAAAEALARAGLPLVKRLMSDPDPDVRLRVYLAAVTHAKDKAAVAGLIDLIGELPAAQAWRAEEVLVRLAGDAAPGVSLGQDEASRRRCRDAWAAWWSDKAETVDLARLDTTAAVMGHTLIIQYDVQPPTVGRVYEVNAAGDVVWKIEGLQQPMDAVMLGRDRVLVAESGANGGRVTLYDIHGAIEWSKEVEAPNTLQALAGGGFLVAGRNFVNEFDDRRRNVATLQRERYDLAAAAKDRNGDYLLVLSNGEFVRLDRQKKELKRFQFAPRLFQAGLEPQPNGRVLIGFTNMVKEFDAEGREVWSAPVRGQPASVQRLANGNTLVAGLNERNVIELDRAKKTVWTYKPADGGLPRKARRR